MFGSIILLTLQRICLLVVCKISLSWRCGTTAGDYLRGGPDTSTSEYRENHLSFQPSLTRRVRYIALFGRVTMVFAKFLVSKGTHPGMQKVDCRTLIDRVHSDRPHHRRLKDRNVCRRCRPVQIFWCQAINKRTHRLLVPYSEGRSYKCTSNTYFQAHNGVHFRYMRDCRMGALVQLRLWC